MPGNGRSCSGCSIGSASSDKEAVTPSTDSDQAGVSRTASPSTHALDAWVDGIRRGSDEAYRAVYDHTAADLLSFAHGMLRNRASAEDVVQQAFLELVAAASTFRGQGEALRVWLFKSVRFRCLDLLRRASAKEIVTDRVPERGVVAEPVVEIEPRLLAALDELSERQRSMVLMRHVTGMSGAEIAAVVGLNRAAVYAVVRRAERKLRDSVTREEPT